MRNLRTLRKDSGLTQFSLAAATGIHRWRISHAELGLLKLESGEIAAIRKVLVAVARKNTTRVLAELETGG